MVSSDILQSDVSAAVDRTRSLSLCIMYHYSIPVVLFCHYIHIVFLIKRPILLELPFLCPCKSAVNHEPGIKIGSSPQCTVSTGSR